MNPIGFEQAEMANYFNRQPSEVKGQANADTEFHKRWLLNKIFSRFNFELPKEWALNYFRFWLFNAGSIAVIYTKEYGWIAQPYGIEKLNLYYQPAKIIVANPFLKATKTGIIGVNAEIIKCFDDYFGFYDIISRYAEKLAQIDRAINVNLMNSNVTVFMEAESNKEAQTMKEAYATATTGVPFIALNKNVLNGKELQPLFKDVKNSYLVTDLLTARRTILNQFLTEIGIDNANYEKRERLNTDEVTQNDDETNSIISVVYANLKDGCERVNKISDLNLNVTLNKCDLKGSEENANDVIRHVSI